jgi:hypothetical protein
MAGNLPVPLGIEMKLTWTLSGTPAAINILHFRNTNAAALSQAFVDVTSTSVKGLFTSSGLAALVWSNVALQTMALRDMTANSNPWLVGAGPATPGTGTENPLPAATALVVSLATGLRGRSYNGRYYSWGWTELANDAAGGATAGASTAAVSFVTGVQNLLNGGANPFVLAVLSRFTTPPGGTATERNPPVLTAVTSVHTKDQRWDVQRRRAVPGI